MPKTSTNLSAGEQQLQNIIEDVKKRQRNLESEMKKPKQQKVSVAVLGNIVPTLPNRPVIGDHCTLYKEKETTLRNQFVPHHCVQNNKWVQYTPEPGSIIYDSIISDQLMVWIDNNEGYRIITPPKDNKPPAQIVTPNKEVVVQLGNIVSKLPDKPKVNSHCTLYVSTEKVPRKQFVPYICKVAEKWETYIPQTGTLMYDNVISNAIMVWTGDKDGFHMIL